MTAAVDRALALRLEMAGAWRAIRYAEAWGRLWPEVQAASKPIAGGWVVYAGQTAPANRVFALGLSEPVSAADLDQIQSWYASRGLAPRVELCPLADPSLLAMLGEAGYRLERFSSLLVRPISPEDRAPRPSAGIRITRASPADEPLWLSTVSEGFAGLHTRPETTSLAPNWHTVGSRCYLAWIANEAVGGGALVIHQGVAELCSASTRPLYRRRGVQTALVHARLADAWAAGCDIATAVALPGSDSQRNLERLGFQLAYTKAILVGRQDD